MSTATGSISVSGLLGGTAGQIDTTALISQLMQAAALPQTQLKDQLSTVSSQLSAYQSVNTKMTALQAAAEGVTDPDTWHATAATSSSPAVAATSTAAATAGSTTFSVTQLARAQVTTVAADSSGTVVAQPSAGIRVTDSAGVTHTIALTSGSAEAVATAINTANIGVRASVIQTSAGTILQVSSAKTGASNGFSLNPADLTNPANTVVAAQDAEVTVGDPAAGGYSVTSATNTFTNLIPGVTFSASATASDVTITVDSDEQSMSDKVQALVDAANAAMTVISSATGKGAVLQGKYDVSSLGTAIASAVSSGTSTGASLKSFGIDIDSTGKLTFDAKAFASAYGADPAGTQTAAAQSFASALDTTASAAVAPTTGGITVAIASATTQTSNLNDEIDAWSTRLDQIQASLQTKYTAMETALARLQSQQTYLTSMFNSMTKSSSDSSS